MTMVSLDLETLDVRPDAVILAIGACWRDKHGQKSFFQIVPEYKDQGDRWGRTISPATLEWWREMDQAEARKAWDNDMTKPSLAEALAMFRDWLDAEIPEINDREILGNGAGFDNAILAHAFATVLGERTPWNFWNDRCLRTYRDVEKRLCETFRCNRVERPEPRVAHSAVADAAAQLEWAEQIEANLKRMMRR